MAALWPPWAKGACGKRTRPKPREGRLCTHHGGRSSVGRTAERRKDSLTPASSARTLSHPPPFPQGLSHTRLLFRNDSLTPASFSCGMRPQTPRPLPVELEGRCAGVSVSAREPSGGSVTGPSQPTAEPEPCRRHRHVLQALARSLLCNFYV